MQARVINICIIFFFIIGQVWSQVYVEKQSRHRFAQMSMGFDMETSIGGTTSWIQNGDVLQKSLPSSNALRFVIGGTHFWGHADFNISIPVYVNGKFVEDREMNFRRGVETIFKYYPWRIERGKVRPYIGTSIMPFYFKQGTNQESSKIGPSVNFTYFPLNTGLTFNTGNHLIEAGLTWNYNNKETYYISRNSSSTLKTPPLYANISYKYILDTTIGAEKSWESGRTKEVTQILADRGELNNFFVSVGMSSAWWGDQGSYTKEERPFLGRYGASVMPEFSIGYYHHNSDIHFNLAYRGYAEVTSAYGLAQRSKRKSLVLEGAKVLGDYHGFCPFIGPAISYEDLCFEEWDSGSMTIDERGRKLGYGVTFGWDIRPNRLQGFILRTNLRWFPNLKLDLDNGYNASFNNLEFNFIQLVLYPGRLF